MDLINLDDYREGEYLFAALAMCMAWRYPYEESEELCLNRWVAGVPKDTSLFRLQCPKCGGQNSFATVLPSEYMENFGIQKKE